MVRINKTISFKKEIYDKIIELRKGKCFSEFVNDLLEDLLLEKSKKAEIV